MAGKARTDRATIADKHLGLRLNATEHATLTALVDDTNAKLEAQGLPPSVSQTILVKHLIMEEAKRRHLLLLAATPMNAMGLPETGDVIVLTEKHRGPHVSTAREEPVRIAAARVDRPHMTKVIADETGKVVKRQRIYLDEAGEPIPPKPSKKGRKP